MTQHVTDKESTDATASTHRARVPSSRSAGQNGGYSESQGYWFFSSSSFILALRNTAELIEKTRSCSLRPMRFFVCEPLT